MNKYAEVAKKKFYSSLSKFEYLHDELGKLKNTERNRQIVFKKIDDMLDEFGFNIYCQEVMIEFLKEGINLLTETKHEDNKNAIRQFVSIVLSDYVKEHNDMLNDEFKILAVETSKLFMVECACSIFKDRD